MGQKRYPNKCFDGSTTAIHKEQFAFFVYHGIQNSFVCGVLIIIEPIFYIVRIYGQ
jgi:hypothetical protein